MLSTLAEQAGYEISQPTRSRTESPELYSLGALERRVEGEVEWIIESETAYHLRLDEVDTYRIDKDRDIEAQVEELNKALEEQGASQDGKKRNVELSPFLTPGGV